MAERGTNGEGSFITATVRTGICASALWVAANSCHLNICSIQLLNLKNIINPLILEQGALKTLSEWWHHHNIFSLGRLL